MQVDDDRCSPTIISFSPRFLRRKRKPPCPVPMMCADRCTELIHNDTSPGTCVESFLVAWRTFTCGAFLSRSLGLSNSVQIPEQTQSCWATAPGVSLGSDVPKQTGNLPDVPLYSSFGALSTRVMQNRHNSPHLLIGFFFFFVIVSLGCRTNSKKYFVWKHVCTSSCSSSKTIFR